VQPSGNTANQRLGDLEPQKNKSNKAKKQPAHTRADCFTYAAL
jgi:hypothetical protein